MKDDQIAKLHNDLRDTAIKYAGSQQLRARLATVVYGLTCEVRDQRTWDIMPIRAILSGEVTAHRLSIPCVGDDLIVKSLQIEDHRIDLCNDLFHRLGNIKRKLEVIGEIKVPNNVTLNLIE